MSSKGKGRQVTSGKRKQRTQDETSQNTENPALHGSNNKSASMQTHETDAPPQKKPKKVVGWEHLDTDEETPPSEFDKYNDIISSIGNAPCRSRKRAGSRIVNVGSKRAPSRNDAETAAKALPTNTVQPESTGGDDRSRHAASSSKVGSHGKRHVLNDDIRDSSPVPDSQTTESQWVDFAQRLDKAKLQWYAIKKGEKLLEKAGFYRTERPTEFVTRVRDFQDFDDKEDWHYGLDWLELWLGMIGTNVFSYRIPFRDTDERMHSFPDDIVESESGRLFIPLAVMLRGMFEEIDDMKARYKLKLARTRLDLQDLQRANERLKQQAADLLKSQAANPQQDPESRQPERVHEDGVGG